MFSNALSGAGICWPLKFNWYILSNENEWCHLARVIFPGKIKKGNVTFILSLSLSYLAGDQSKQIYPAWERIINFCLQFLCKICLPLFGMRERIHLFSSLPEIRTTSSSAETKFPFRLSKPYSFCNFQHEGFPLSQFVLDIPSCIRFCNLQHEGILFDSSGY